MLVLSCLPTLHNFLRMSRKTSAQKQRKDRHAEGVLDGTVARSLESRDV